MSDTWYREPFSIAPLWTGDQAWNFDGSPANEAATKAVEAGEYLRQFPNELIAAELHAQIVFGLYKTYSDELREEIRKWPEPRGLFSALDVDL